MRLPFLSAGPAKPSDYRPLPKAIAGQGQHATGDWRAPGVVVPSRAIAAQDQQATARGRSRALAAQGQAALARGRSRVLAQQEQRATAAGSAPANRWPNGYLNQHEIRLRAWATGAPSVSNFLLPFAEQSDAFKLVANGGGVEHASGYDIRFETTGGTKLGHILIRYDGTAGRIVALVNMPRNFAAAESIFLYVGKPGLGSSEEDAAAAREGGTAGDWLAWFKGGSGTDLTGQGRDLTASGSPASGLVGLWPAYDFDGVDDYLGQAGSSWLNGLAAISAVQLYDADFANELRELWNVSVDTAGELGFRFKGSDRRLVAIAKYGASSFTMESANDTQPAPSAGLSPFVHRYPLRIETAAPGDIITPSSFSVLGINNYTIPAGKILDCRGKRARHHDPSQGINIASFRLNMGNNSTFTGGTSYTTNAAYMAMTWGESHGHPQWDNPPGIRIDSAPAGGKVYIEGVDLRDNMDAIIPSSSVNDTAELYFNAVRIPGCPDDPWQNDNGRLIKEIKNALIVGHTTLSERPGVANGNTIKYRHCLIWKKRRRWDGDEKWHNGQYTEPGANPGKPGSRKVGPWISPTEQNNADVSDLKSTDGWGHQGLWKFGDGNTIVDMEDCLIRVDTIPVNGPTDFFLPNPSHVMNRVTLLWMQGGTCPLTPIPPGVTVLTDTDLCYEIWNKAYADWHTVNGFNPTTDDLDWTRAP